MEDLGRIIAMIKRTLQKLGSQNAWEISRARKQIAEFIELFEDLQRVNNLGMEIGVEETKEDAERAFEKAPTGEDFKFDLEKVKKNFKPKK